MKRREKFLVIGSNSFSGATFISHLLEKGQELIGISRSQEPNRCFLPYRWSDDTGRFRFVRGDLNHDLEQIVQVIDAERPAYVVNFAAQSMVAESWKNPDHWFMTNTVATVRLQQTVS